MCIEPNDNGSSTYETEMTNTDRRDPQGRAHFYLNQYNDTKAMVHVLPLGWLEMTKGFPLMVVRHSGKPNEIYLANSVGGFCNGDSMEYHAEPLVGTSQKAHIYLESGCDIDLYVEPRFLHDGNLKPILVADDIDVAGAIIDHIKSADGWVEPVKAPAKKGTAKKVAENA